MECVMCNGYVNTLEYPQSREYYSFVFILPVCFVCVQVTYRKVKGPLMWHFNNLKLSTLSGYEIFDC